MPDVADAAEALARADDTKSALSMQGEAGAIGGQYLRLKRPIALGLGGPDEALDQGSADALSLSLIRHVYADLSDAGSASGVSDA